MAEYSGPVNDPGLVEFAAFTGLRNNVAEDNFSETDLAIALNVDIDDSLGLSRRKGRSAPVTSAVDRDLWASGPVCLGVGSNALKLVNEDYSTVTLRSGLTTAKHLAYCEVGGRVFWSNGIEMGVVQDGANRTWGIAPPGAFSVVAV